jgi:hypothetical protein
MPQAVRAVAPGRQGRCSLAETECYVDLVGGHPTGVERL